MKATETYLILSKMDAGEITLQEAHERILRLFGIVEQKEPLKCQCKKAEFTRTVDADFNPLCGRCGKAI